MLKVAPATSHPSWHYDRCYSAGRRAHNGIYPRLNAICGPFRRPALARSSAKHRAACYPISPERNPGPAQLPRVERQLCWHSDYRIPRPKGRALGRSQNADKRCGFSCESAYQDEESPCNAKESVCISRTATSANGNTLFRRHFECRKVSNWSERDQRWQVLWRISSK